MIGNTAPPSGAPRSEWVPTAWLSDEVMVRRVASWCLDGVLIAMLAGALWLFGFIFGLLTLGLGFPVLRLLPVVPFAYHWLSLVSPLSATPGQRVMDLIVRRNEDMGAPNGTEALVSVLAFYATLALGAIWLALALFTARHRAPHDLLSGLVVVRARALDGAGPAPASGVWTMRFGGRFNA